MANAPIPDDFKPFMINLPELSKYIGQILTAYPCSAELSNYDQSQIFYFKLTEINSLSAANRPAEIQQNPVNLTLTIDRDIPGRQANFYFDTPPFKEEIFLITQLSASSPNQPAECQLIIS